MFNVKTPISSFWLEQIFQYGPTPIPFPVGLNPGQLPQMWNYVIVKLSICTEKKCAWWAEMECIDQHVTRHCRNVGYWFLHLAKTWSGERVHRCFDPTMHQKWSGHGPGGNWRLCSLASTTKPISNQNDSQ